MIIGDDWFTKNMLINALARNEQIKSQSGTITSDFGDLFTSVLNELMQKELPSTITPSLQSFVDHLQTNPLSTNNEMTNTDLKINTFSTNEPLRFQVVSSDKINQILNGKLKGMGEAFVKAGQKYNVNPALLTAIAQHETGNGTSKAAYIKNNVAGMMGKNGLKSYSSIEESIMDMARNLSKNYIGIGLTSISKIAGKYAPIGAGNDPIGLNNHWVNGVSKFFDQLKA
ncbi:glucosaminidase domain-containing protein [Neobacillus drentensis]|uniref:glucosaminidase domain-containing protein n=1 Tax=Neobacillus drentensis TaxID=220684 RepID=UPI003000CE47